MQLINRARKKEQNSEILFFLLKKINEKTPNFFVNKTPIKSLIEKTAKFQ